MTKSYGMLFNDPTAKEGQRFVQVLADSREEAKEKLVQIGVRDFGHTKKFLEGWDDVWVLTKETLK